MDIFRDDYLAGRPPWHYGATVVAVILVFNVLLVLLAIPFSFFRKLILHPVGSLLVGLVLGKYLIINVMILFVRWVRLGLHRDYRRRLSEDHPALKSWEVRQYVPPEISIPDECEAPDETAGAGTADPAPASPRGAVFATEPVEALAPVEGGAGQSVDGGPNTPNRQIVWRSVFERLLKDNQRCLWIVEGESGLGKTALLEKWTTAALENGKTPFLIPLGGGLRAAEEISESMRRFGDLIIGDAAADVVNAGGFVVLLDGFNEDRAPNDTRRFVGQAIKHNLVIMTSQYSPKWTDIPIRRIRLRPFGRPQLKALITEEWIDRLFERDDLKPFVRLPHTAGLVAEFIRRNKALPASQLDIYEDLVTRLATKLKGAGLSSLVSNLELESWHLFQQNWVFLAPTEGLPERLLEAACGADVGILTSASQTIRGKQETQYRFRHELIHRYFVARYLYRQDHQTIAHWHGQLEGAKGQDKDSYWGSILRFWAQMHAQKARTAQDQKQAGRSTEAYLSFLRDVGGFNLSAFKMVYRDARRLSRLHDLALDEDFIDWAASLMAGEDDDS